MFNSKSNRESKRKEAPWAKLPLELLKKYGSNVAVVYSILLDVCARGSVTAIVRREWLAKTCKMSLRTIDRVLKKLEELGLIRKSKRSRASSYEITPVIRLKGEWKNDKPETPAEQSCPSNARTAYYKRKQDKFISPEEKAELDEYLDLVNCFDD